MLSFLKSILYQLDEDVAVGIEAAHELVQIVEMKRWGEEFPVLSPPIPCTGKQPFTQPLLHQPVLHRFGQEVDVCEHSFHQLRFGDEGELHHAQTTPNVRPEAQGEPVPDLVEDYNTRNFVLQKTTKVLSNWCTYESGRRSPKLDPEEEYVVVHWSPPNTCCSCTERATSRPEPLSRWWGLSQEASLPFWCVHEQFSKQTADWSLSYLCIGFGLFFWVLCLSTRSNNKCSYVAITTSADD